MNVTTAAVCFLSGLALPPALAWAVFVYPYQDDSWGVWRGVALPFGGGFCVGVAAIFGILLWMAQVWPRD
jgi:hypothetical protein